MCLRAQQGWEGKLRVEDAPNTTKSGCCMYAQFLHAFQLPTALCPLPSRLNPYAPAHAAVEGGCSLPFTSPSLASPRQPNLTLAHHSPGVVSPPSQAAVEEGIVTGGGCTLLRLSNMVDAFKATLTDDEQKVGQTLTQVWLV